jgi:hypothetical protein
LSYRKSPNYLFNGSEMYAVIQHQEKQMIAAIDALASDYIVQVSADDLSDHLADKYRLDTPVLRMDEIHIATHGEADVDVSRDQMRFISDRSQPFYIKGTFAVFAVPFEGDATLFTYKPSTLSTIIPIGEIVGSEVHLRYESTDHDPERIRSAFDRDISQIQQHLKWINESAVKFNSGVREKALEHIEWRKQKLLKDQDMTSGLGYPVKRREDAPRTYAVPVSRRRVAVPKPVATDAPQRFEPALDVQEYERILNIISNMEMVMERSPKAFAGMCEEDMRQHFLVQLNGQYEGQATGETFNFEGKTDILIRVDGRNIFIAECKFWKGAEGFRKTIDQFVTLP